MGSKNKRRTTEEFINEMKVVNPNIKILGEYINNRTPIQYQCECGDVYFKAPESLLNGQKCRKCGVLTTAKKRTITQEKFIERMKIVNPKIKILEEYINNRTKIRYCCECGIEATAKPGFLLNGGKCMNCGRISTAKKGKITHEQFVERMYEVNPNIKILGEYVDCRTNVKFLCVCGDENYALPFVLLRGGLCKKCGIKKAQKSMTNSNEDFIERMYKVNPQIEILEEYKGTHIKLKYRCECGSINYSTPHILLAGHKCPFCKKNYGENKVLDFLQNNKINFIRQYTFNDCKYKGVLFFDFYLTKENICIEYDGEQHYRAVAYFGGEEDFKERQIRDGIKNDYCNKNNINLIRIPYWDFDNIHTILSEKLGIQKDGEISA